MVADARSDAHRRVEVEWWRSADGPPARRQGV